MKLIGTKKPRCISVNVDTTGFQKYMMRTGGIEPSSQEPESHVISITLGALYNT